MIFSNVNIVTLPNVLSSLRIPLAFLFLSQNTTVRLVAIFFAMMTDVLDGYFARRNGHTSQFGAFIDPLTDKFFMLFALIVALSEGHLELWQVTALLSRDFAVALFGFYLAISNQWTNYRVQAIWAGKVSTTLQLLVLFSLVMQLTVPLYFYYVFIGLGLAAFIELTLIVRKKKI